MRRYLRLALAVLLLALSAGCGAEAVLGEPEEALAAGWQAYSLGDFEFAETAFLHVTQDEEATEEHRYSALLGLASTHHFNTRPNLEAAARYYERLAGVAGERGARQSLLGLGMVELAREEVSRGRGHLHELIDLHPESREAGEAVLYLADSYFRPEEDGEAVGGFRPARASALQQGLEVLEERLSAHPDDPLASVMHMMLGRQYVQMAEFRRAVEHLQAALRLGVASETNRAEVTWQVARIAEMELQDYELAEEHYAIYARDFPRTQQYYRAARSLERVRELQQEAQ